jgi:hypothetical protein
VSADIAQSKLEEYQTDALAFRYLWSKLRVKYSVAWFLLTPQNRQLADFLEDHLPEGFEDMRKDQMERHLAAMMQRISRECARSVRRMMKKRPATKRAQKGKKP